MRRPSPVAVVWVLHAATAAAIGVTHARVPPERLYNSRRGGLSRVLVFACYPTAAAAVATLPFRRGRGRWAALPPCATAAPPGVVHEHHLDGRRRNLPAAAGVLLAAAATLPGGASDPSVSRRRWVLALGLAEISAPWVLTDLGVQTSGMRQPS